MGYNLKNARKGKSILKIPKWPSLKNQKPGTQQWEASTLTAVPYLLPSVRFNLVSSNPDFDLSTQYSIH